MEILLLLTNIEKIKFSGNKFTDKNIIDILGYPGGIKSTKPKIIIKKVNLKKF